MKIAKLYKKAKDPYLNRLDDMGQKMKFHILLLFFGAFAVIVYSAYCTVDMKIQDSEATKLYAQNYTEQIAHMMDLDIRNRIRMVNSLAESIAKNEKPDQVQEFLDRKRKMYDFDFGIFQSDMEDITVNSGEVPENMEDMEDMQNTGAFFKVLENGLCAVGLNGGNLLMAKNVYFEGEKAGTLWIGDDEEELHDIFVTNTLQKENRASYIINNQGYILLSSDGEARNLNLAVLLGNDEDTQQEIIKMRDRIAEGKNGVFHFSMPNHKRYYLSYAVTQIDEWVAVSIFPANLFTGFSDIYVKKMLGSSGASFLIFGGVFFLLFKNYSDSSKKIKHIAFHDEITEGINRNGFQMRYQELCRQRKADQYTLVLMDCMDFKMINDSLGALNGDRMLKYFYTVITSFLKPELGEFAARTEMDHYFICMKEKDKEIIGRRLNRIVDEINSFRESEIPVFSISFWLGACAIEDNDTDLTILQDQVTAVIKDQDRQEVGNLFFYNSTLAEKIQNQREMERHFEDSLLNGDFHVYFQPKIDIQKRKIVGAEALVRWIMPGRGIVSPADFIPLLESNGKIRILDRYVFDYTCSWLARRKQAGQRIFPISVNLSRSHFVNENFLADFVRLADKYQIDRSLLEFEVTESIFLNGSQIRKVKEGIQMIHRYGFRCSLDDFGFGYSSLTLLKEFEIDVLKLDRSFFLDLEDKKARDVLTCIVEMADRLNIHIVAEGIESEYQIAYLKTINCNTVQGFYFSRPLPAPDFDRWIRSFEITQ